MIPNQYMTKSIIGKKNLRINSLSQLVKMGTQTYYLVQMIGVNSQDKFYSWENSFVIEKYFGLDQKQLLLLKQAGKQVEQRNKWPSRKAEAIKQVMDKFMKLETEETIPIAQMNSENNCNNVNNVNNDGTKLKKQSWDNSINQHSTNFIMNKAGVDSRDNQIFKKRMLKQAEKQKDNMQFYVIQGFKKDYYTGEVIFYVLDEMGELIEKTYEEMKRKNMIQIVAYLQSKIVKYK